MRDAAIRMMDCSLAALALVVGLPALAVIGLAISVADGLPVFFVQERVGSGGRLFRMYKFRSMRRANGGPLITAAGDSRVTRLGGFLRRYKLDELPQLWNVLKGDMSLVGPRPEVPRYVDAADPLWVSVLRVKPGLTDVATLLYRDEERVLSRQSDPETYYRHEILPHKLELNRRYAERRGVVRNTRLLLATAQSILLPRTLDTRALEQTFLNQ